jgi:hypothetical protein
MMAWVLSMRRPDRIDSGKGRRRFEWFFEWTEAFEFLFEAFAEGPVGLVFALAIIVGIPVVVLLFRICRAACLRFGWFATAYFAVAPDVMASPSRCEKQEVVQWHCTTRPTEPPAFIVLHKPDRSAADKGNATPARIQRDANSPESLAKR